MGKQDINVEIMGKTFNARVCVLIIKNEKVLLQKRKTDKVWALPGGKIQILEKTEDAIRREIKEELDENITDLKFVSFTENFFNLNDEDIHQYIFTFAGNLESNKYDDLDEFDSIEKGKNIIYKWIKIDDLNKVEVRPSNINKQIENLKNNRIDTYIACD